MLSEEKAREMWCPSSRVAVQHGWRNKFVICNRVNERMLEHRNLVGSTCIGSRCMAWRWEDRTFARGYCGMTGKPVVP